MAFPTPSLGADGTSDEAEEKMPLLRTTSGRNAATLRLLEEGEIEFLQEIETRRPPQKRKRRKGCNRHRRILSILLIVVLGWALLRRLIPFTSSWVCLSASQFFLISTTRCELPSWYSVEPDETGAYSPSNISNEIPQYIYDYAPLVHLFSDEKFWPCDMTEHLNHTTPELNYDVISFNDTGLPSLNLSTLSLLNGIENGEHVYLTSDDDVTERPAWLTGEHNKPNHFSTEQIPLSPDPSIPPTHKPTTLFKTLTHGGRSSAPAFLITVPKSHDILDAFFFFFYSYNHGNEVLRLRFGNHVGDWEHTMIRFQHGVPKAVFTSEHNFGTAYAYSAVEKVGKRPVLYSATGTHAMYATPGLQPYILPFTLLHDRTDRGPMWDPLQNLRGYTYSVADDELQASTANKDAPTSWFFFNGHWGDKHYPFSDKRQYSFLGELHYVSGPLGPRFKNLGRRKVCQGGDEEPCELKHWLGGGVGVSNDVVEGGEREDQD